MTVPVQAAARVTGGALTGIVVGALVFAQLCGVLLCALLFLIARSRKSPSLDKSKSEESAIGHLGESSSSTQTEGRGHGELEPQTV